MKYIFITGGVVSGLGKGICAASLGRLLKQRGLRVRNQKFDPYLNVDPGTMSPYQHGEVFVTDDGAETDLDLGHYERFVDERLPGASSVSSGKIYWSVLSREREGGYLGGTVQIIPHITGENRAASGSFALDLLFYFLKLQERAAAVEKNMPSHTGKKKGACSSDAAGSPGNQHKMFGRRSVCFHMTAPF